MKNCAQVAPRSQSPHLALHPRWTIPRGLGKYVISYPRYFEPPPLTGAIFLPPGGVSWLPQALKKRGKKGGKLGR